MGNSTLELNRCLTESDLLCEEFLGIWTMMADGRRGASREGLRLLELPGAAPLWMMETRMKEGHSSFVVLFL